MTSSPSRVKLGRTQLLAAVYMRGKYLQLPLMPQIADTVTPYLSSLDAQI